MGADGRRGSVLVTALGLAVVLLIVVILAPALLLTNVTSAAVLASNCSSGPLAPTTGAYLGADTPQIEPIQSQTGAHLVLDRTYSRWTDPQPARDLVADRAAGRLPALSIKPLGVSLASIANGSQDTVIRAQAAGLRAFGAPLLLTFDHEPEQAGRSAAPQFVAAWRHYVDVFRAEGVTNVAWVPILMATTFRSGTADAWYPGDDYADWLGADGYNWAFSTKNTRAPWTPFATVFSPANAYATSHAKPLLIGEFASADDPNDPAHKPAWITDAATQIKQWPQIKGLAWFGAAPEWRLNTAADQQAFAAMAADPYFQAQPPTSTTSPPAPPGTASVLDTARAAASAGFTGTDLVTAVAVAGAESGYVPTATHVNTDGSVDYGLWQINSTHAALLGSGDWRNPADNARMAYQVWLAAPGGGRNWSPWTTYRTGAYQQYLPTAQQAVQQLGVGGCASNARGASGVVAWALAHLGTPYLWGGCLAGVPSCGAPSRSGQMDCSGFSSAAWWFGAQVAIPRTAAEQWRAATPVPAGQEQPGDLIFSEFGPAGPGHVMIVVTPGNPGVAAEEPHTGDVSKTISYSESGASFGRPHS